MMSNFQIYHGVILSKQEFNNKITKNKLFEDFVPPPPDLPPTTQQPPPPQGIGGIPDKYTCQICGKTFNSEKETKLHIETEHKSPKKKV
jgi:hypothetical protein